MQSINRVGTSPTNAASVSWAVTFSEPVTGVDAADVALATAGSVSGAVVSAVTGSGSQYTYDGEGKRTRRTVDGVQHNYLYDIKASVPLIGGRMERALEPALKAAIGVEQREGTAWLTR